MTVWGDLHLDQTGRGPVFTEQTAEDRLEVTADLDCSKLPSAVLAYFTGLSDISVVRVHFSRSDWSMIQPRIVLNDETLPAQTPAYLFWTDRW
jgi:hypothetical protein